MIWQVHADAGSQNWKIPGKACSDTRGDPNSKQTIHGCRADASKVDADTMLQGKRACRTQNLGQAMFLHVGNPHAMLKGLRLKLVI